MKWRSREWVTIFTEHSYYHPQLSNPQNKFLILHNLYFIVHCSMFNNKQSPLLQLRRTEGNTRCPTKEVSFFIWTPCTQCTVKQWHCIVKHSVDNPTAQWSTKLTLIFLHLFCRGTCQKKVCKISHLDLVVFQTLGGSDPSVRNFPHFFLWVP